MPVYMYFVDKVLGENVKDVVVYIFKFTYKLGVTKQFLHLLNNSDTGKTYSWDISWTANKDIYVSGGIEEELLGWIDTLLTIFWEIEENQITKT